MKILIGKQTAEGESLQVECENLNSARAGLEFCDARLLEMNKRVLNAHTVIKALPPEHQKLFHEAAAILHGAMKLESISPATVAEEAPNA